MPLSGPDWVSQFPTSKSADDLAEPFRSRAKKFLAALQAAGAKIEIGDTLRSPERAYLMHYAFRIARKGMDPATVPAMAGVDIEWTHPESAESVDAAEAMLASYEIVHEPALDTRHTEGLAIDMTIAWLGELRIARADGSI
ncbi:MAG: peptidoglycan-binding protein, partial [Acidobacteriia bacterium]|nr:peptidoglycan-binding protein [Terriglobia bacterium]